MRTRMAPLVAAVVGLVWVAGSASAAYYGAATYGCSESPCCDAQTNFAASAANLRASFKLVAFNDGDCRFQTSYQTVQETCMKPVTRTSYTTEQRTGYRN